MDHEFLTVQEVADYLRVDDQRIREAIHRKDLRAHRIGKGNRGEYRIARADVHAYLRMTETREPYEDEDGSSKKVA